MKTEESPMSEKCLHEAQFLVGTAKGIECKKCGKVFKSFLEIANDIAGDKPKAPRKRSK